MGGATSQITPGPLVYDQAGRGAPIVGKMVDLSARELGLSEDHGGLLELASDAPVGRDIRTHLNLDDTLFTLKLTPNLGHALSVYGVAREVSALTGSPLVEADCAPVPPQIADRLPVRIEAPELCGRFSGRVIRGVNPKASTPSWMVERLARCGQRSVSALVDISNYVMFELGRPTHIFDLDRIDQGLVVRWALPGERLELLNGQTVSLDEQVGVIADAKAIESLAGIMGGQATAVSDDTRNVYVEAAFWWPEAVAGRSRRFNFSTDAGHRFERGVDPALTVAHIERITQLIQAICGGEAGPIDDQTVNVPVREPVRMRVARASRLLGMPLSTAQCADVFDRLGLAYTQQGDSFEVQPPSWRFDLAIEEDLVEEVIRVIGLHQLPQTPPQGHIVATAQPEGRRTKWALRHQLADRGYFETITFSFVEERWERELAGNPDPIRVLNPIAAPLSVMRSSLIGSLVDVLRTNLSRKAARVRLFEMGRVFMRDADAPAGPLSVAGVRQPLRLAGLAWGSAEGLQWGRRDRHVDFFDVKGDLETLFPGEDLRFETGHHPALHPGRCARVLRDGELIGHVGELHPRWRQAYELPSAPIVFELDGDAVRQCSLPEFRPLPRQQLVMRDLALVVKTAVTHDDLVASLQADPQGLIRRASVFDIYKPTQGASGMSSDEQSVAVRLELLDDAQPLNDERIEQALDAALQRAAQAVSARLRT